MLLANQQQNQQNSTSSTNYGKSPTARDLKVLKKKVCLTTKKQTNNKVTCTSSQDKSPLKKPQKAAIRVGSNFQVLSLPEGKGRAEASKSPARDECLWRMHQRIKDEDLSSYCIDAFTNFGIEPERALFILFKSNYDFDKARYKLHNKHIINDSFCSEDAYAFRTALMSYGKNFARVKQILPHKTIASLVEHYYKTKKNQNYKGDFEHYTDIAANYSSSPSDDDTDGSEFIKPFCEVCKEVVTKIYSINGLEVCKTCKQSTNHYQIFPQTSENHNNYIPKCPSDMQQICNEFVEMAKYINKSNLIEENNKDQDDDDLIFVIKKSKTICETKIEDMDKASKLLQASTRRIMQDVQKQKSVEGIQKYSLVDALQFLSKSENSFNSNKHLVNSKWLQWEKDAVFNALIRFEADENAVSEIIPTKNPKMIKQFYLEFKEQIDEEIQKGLLESKDFNFFNNGEGCSSNNDKFIVKNNEPEIIELD